MSEELRNTKTIRARKQTSDRLVLNSQLQEKSKSWLNQVNEHFKGMVILKRNEILTALLEDVPNVLPQSVLDKIQQEKLTDIQKAKWIYDQLKNAKIKGEDLNLEGLLKMANRSSNRKNKGHKTPPKKFKESSVAGIEKLSSEVKKLNNNNELK